MNQEPTPAKGRLTDGLGADCESFGALICEAEEPPEGRAELRLQHGEIKSMRAERRHTERRLLAVEAQRDALLEALKAMLHRDERNTCCHEETHRGGALWEICDSCGAMWARDGGGQPEWEDPKEWTQARAAIKAVEGGK